MFCQSNALPTDLPCPTALIQWFKNSLLQSYNEYVVTVAGLVRQFPDGEEGFLSLDGFSVLMRAMQSDEEKLQVKAAFLLANIVLSDQKHKGTTSLFRLHKSLVLNVFVMLFYVYADSRRFHTSSCKSPYDENYM